ncbi:MAG: hypothetical protein EGR44_10355 [Ruminococcaceae bacterium]|nr:hypothetical protein [Oscillospiraceae bacterium]MBD9072025.1 hypothetical protein [Oscillospiraceae bacterium]
METIDDRIKRVNSKYEAPESIDERIKRANDKYQWDSSDKEMHDWFESTGRTTRSANNRLQNSSYANWKRDSENTKSAVNNDLEKADRIKSYLDSQREQLGEERYNTFMARYEEYKNALQQTSQNLQKESDYYSDTRNSGVMDTMTEDDMKGRLDDIKNEKKKNRSESFKNRVWAFLSTMQGNTADYEKYTEEAKAAKNKLNNLKSESAALESEIYNRDISEKLSQFDEATLKEIQSIPELKDRIKLEESVGTSGNNKNVYEYNQRLKEIEDKVRAKGMNPDELENYFAYEYNRRKNEQVQDAVRDFSADHQVIASALSVPVNLTSSGAGYLDAAAQQVGRKLTGSYAPVDYNRDAGIASRLSDTARGAVMDEHDWKLGDWDAFDFLYGTGMSALDSAASAAAGNLVGGALANTGAGIKAAGKVAEAVGGGILGLSAANSTMRDIKARGGNDDQAVIGGAVSGIFEGLFEKVSIGNFNKLKEVDPRSMRDVAMNILKSTGVNFSEEAATEIANIAYDTIANGDISNYKLMIAAYEKQGLSEAKAKKKVAGDLALQVVEAGAGGALMGAGFGVVGSGLGYLNHRKQGTNITGKTVAGFAGGEQTQIAQRLESLGENTQDAVRLSAVVQKQAEGDKLTRAEKRLFRGSENAQNVAAEIKNGTSDAAEDSQLSLKKDIETIKQEYKKAVNPKIVDFVERVRNLKDKNVAGKIKIELSSVNEREVQDIKKLTGIDTSEYKRDMDGNTVIHVENRHGENGAADHSMSDVNDLARIEYVLENYDNIESAKDDNGRYRDSDNKLSKSVVYSKRVNGNYYVVEAVPDSKAKTLHVVSAYKTKAEGVSQVLNMSEDLQSTSKTPHALAPSDNNISQKKSYVNAVPATIDGQSVTINGIDRIENDGNRAQMYVRTQDGGSVALSDVRFDSRETEALYNVAQGFDSTDTARAFISGYKQGDSASEYMNAFLDFRRAGQLGQDFDSVLQSNANKYAGLEESQLRQAYYAGVNEKNNAPKHYSAKEEKRAEKNGGLLRNYTKKLNSEQAGSVYVLEALAKKYGFVVEVCDTLADGMANGEYDPKTGRIKIALDAEENAYLRTAGHELYHYIEDWNSTAAGELREYVIGKLKESENYDYEGRVKELEKLYEGYGQEDIEAEIVAECMFDVFDEQTIKELVGENRSLAVKIQSWIQGFIESINEILKNLGLTSPEIRALEGDEEALETISDLFKSALEQTRENKSQGKTTDMADEKKKYSIGKTTKNKSVVVIADDILKGVDKSDWVAKVKDVIRTKFSDGIPVEGKLIKVNKITRNEYTNSKNTQHYQRKDAVIYKDKFKASSNLNEIVLASTNYVNEDLKHQRKDNFTEFARGDVLVRVGKNDYSAKVIVGFTSGKEMVLYDIVDFTPTKFELKNENAFTEQPLKVQLSRQHASSDTRVTQSEPSVNSSISEKAQNDAKKFSLKDTTNESDSQTKSEAFKEWFGDWENEPESASKVVNEDGTPRIIYHQTAAEFNVFSNANPLAGRNDSETPNGFFAKDNDADIGVGGNKQMALYGDMKKPLHFKDRAEAKAWYSEHIDGYKGLTEKLNKLDEEYQSKYDAQETANDEYYEQNYEAYVADDAEVTKKILENEDKLDDILEQWKEDTEAIRGELRELLDSYFIENDSGYDGIILDFDGRRKGENVKSYIFFKNTQLKSATDNVGLFDRKNPDIRYSLKSTSAIEEQNKKLMQENKALREYKRELEWRLGINRKELDERAIRRLSKKVLKEYSSKYNAETLTQNLKNIFEALANMDDGITYDEVIARTAEVAKAVLEESAVLNTDMSEQYSALSEYAKGTKIKLSEQQKKEIAYYYGSYDKFRRKNFGKIRLSEEGSTLDSLWSEMSELWPEFFEPDTHELEQVQTLVNALETIKPFYENPFYDGSFDMDIDTASYDLAMRLYEEYYDIPELKTLRQKIEKEYRDRYDKRVEKIKEQEAAKRHKLSEELIKQKALYEQRTFEDRREWLRKDAMAKSKRSIERTAKTLNRFLQNPNKTQHVPEALRSALGEFLVSLDVYGNSQSKDAFEWRKSMSELQGELRKMQQGNDPQYQQFLADLDPDLMPMMTTLLEVYKGSSIKDMDAQGLAELETVMQQIKGGITRANELLANSRYGTVQAIADASVHEMDSRKSFKDKVKVGYKQLNVNMLDSFSFFHQLGPAAETVFKSIRSGFDERVEMIDNANEFMRSIVSQKEIQDWEHSKQTFKVEGGELTLTVSQMMELYNLSKREQARNHLLLGGIRPLDTSRQEAKMRIKEQFGKGEETYAKAVQVTVEDLGKIIDSLTPKQKQVAEKMQGFLSGNVADWGNKASMTLYGYRKFTEEHYWPIQVNKNSVRTMNAEDGAVQTQSNFYKLVNIGATKSVQRNASNGLFIKGAFDTFTKHITEMSAYSAYAVPITDAMKWYNALSFEEKDDGYIAISGTKQSIERAFGNDGKAYFEKFILDLNGSSDSKNAGGAGEEALIRNFKVAAVGANIRVAIQQPTAYLRAAAVMNPKYLLKGLLSKPASKEAIDNCPIAKWKSWGFYETSMGITMKQLITGQKTVVDKIREKSMWLAGVGDELTWGTLWNACKAEVKDKTDLKEGTAEFTQAVSDRLSEVVDKTQVVDSLLHRSQFMRSTSSFSKILSAFKAEPTKSYNMLRNALVDYNNADPGSKKAKAKNIARIAAVHIATSILTAGIASIADAFRNDDDEKKWLELYLEAFGGNTLDGINPFSAVPYVGDILSILSGYSASRMDIEGIEELIQSCESWQKVFSGEKKNPDIWKLMMSSAKGISKVSGLPIANTMRTFESLYNFFSPDNLGREASSTEYRKLYNSIAEGKYQKQYDKLIKKGYTAQQLENGVKNNLVKSEPRIAQAAQARERGNISEYKKIYEELVSEGYPSNAVIKAINNYMTMQTAAAQAKSNGDDSALSGKLEALLESGYDEDEVDRMIDEIAAELDPEAEQDKAVEEKKLYEYKDLQKALENSDVSSAKEIVEYLRANGKEDKTIRQALTKDLKSEYQEMYKSNDTEGMRRTRQMLYELNIGYDDKTFQRWIKDMTK